jgi:predicted GIY-YIG superfamily endonuclease
VLSTEIQEKKPFHQEWKCKNVFPVIVRMIGKIYMIISENTPFFYVGSTTKPLSKRLWQHKRKARRRMLTSSVVIRAGNYKIVLLEEVDVSSKELLELIEYQVIDEMTCDGSLYNRCVNKRRNLKTLLKFYLGVS